MPTWKLLLSIVLGISLPLVSFVDLAVAIWHNPTGFSWEKSLLLAIHQTRVPELDYVAEKLTGLGTEWGVAPVTAIFLLVFARKKYWYGFAYLLLMIGGGWAISYNLKIAFHRVRPQLWELFYPLPLDFAFPSGHALFSALLVISLAILSWRTRWFVAVLSIGIPFVTAIAWTRLYLGVHFPTDILGSWMLAIAWSSIVYLFFRGLFGTPRANFPVFPPD